MRSRIEEAMVASYRSCALGAVNVTPQNLTLHSGETGSFHTALTDLSGQPLDGRRGIAWRAEALSDWQRSVVLNSDGLATARYVGGTTVTAATRNLLATAGVTVTAAALHASSTETFSAQWVLLGATTSDVTPIPPFEIPPTGWSGGSCSEKAEFESNGRVGSFSKQCTEDYRVITDEFASAAKYEARFFETRATTPLFSVSSSSVVLHGAISGPAATMDLLPGPIPVDRINVAAFDAFGHLLATGKVCLRGCVGWPPDP
jgi:hypothetical protein